MDIHSYLRITFFCLAGIFFLFTLFFEIWQKKWKWLGIDIFVYFIQMPLWLILGFALLGIFPGLIYSYFSGIWLCVGLFLWFVPHGILAVKALRQKDWFNVLCAVSVILAIIFFCLFIHLGDMTKKALWTVPEKGWKVASCHLFLGYLAFISEKLLFSKNYPAA